MKFHVTLIHTPESCPGGHGSPPPFSDWRARAAEVGLTLTSAVVDQMGHTQFCVVETDDITKLQEFYRPWLGIARAEVRPVRDLMNP